MQDHPTAHMSRTRMDVILSPPLAESFLDYLRRDVMPKYPMTALIDTVDVLRADDFTASATIKRASRRRPFGRGSAAINHLQGLAGICKPLQNCDSISTAFARTEAVQMMLDAPLGSIRHRAIVWHASCHQGLMFIRADDSRREQ